jgi:hypothetical protein
MKAAGVQADSFRISRYRSALHAPPDLLRLRE